jgi:diguanylate cyclase (GGDEF)-like protein
VHGGLAEGLHHGETDWRGIHLEHGGQARIGQPDAHGGVDDEDALGNAGQDLACLEVLARIDLHRTVAPAGTAPDEKQNCRGRQTARELSYLPAWLTAAGGLVITGLLSGMLLLLYKRADAQRMAEGFAEQIRGMAYHDSLTGLPNRMLLLDRLRMALAGCRRTGEHGALMMVDLDNFKPLNDTHGHATGDLLLVEVARRLQACVRHTDTVARFGGDEFIVLLPGLEGGEEQTRREAASVADKILAVLSRPCHLAEIGSGLRAIEHICSSSIGLTLFGPGDEDFEAIIKRADTAMYEAKRKGRNRFSLHADTSAAAGTV